MFQDGLEICHDFLGDLIRAARTFFHVATTGDSSANAKIQDPTPSGLGSKLENILYDRRHTRY
jgi:hypothetical protein